MSTMYGPKAVTTNLLLALDAGNTKSYQTASSTTWYDLSGNNNSASLYYGASGSGAGSIVFDGIDDTALTNISLNSISAQTSFTLEVVTKIPGYPVALPVTNSYGRVDKLGILFGSGYYAGAGIYWRGDPSSSYCMVNAWMRTISASYIVGYFYMAPNVPYHFTMVNDIAAGNLSFYVTGTLFGTAAGPIVADYNQTYVGVAGPIGLSKPQVDSGGTGNYVPYSGSVSLARIYNKALTADEVRQNFTSIRTRFGM